MEKSYYDGTDSEWICTNGIGGYSLGSRDLINRRKYHGLLVASDENLRRVHLVSSIEEQFIVDGRSVYTDSNDYNNVIYPMGFKKLLKSWLRPYPAFLYNLSINNDDCSYILKEIFMDNAENSVLISYTNISNHNIEYRFRPKFTVRDHHWVNKPGTYDKNPIYIENGIRNGCNFGYLKRTDFPGGEVYFYSDKGSIVKDILIFRNVYYVQEAERGYDAFEDLISPFLHHGLIERGESIQLLFSDRKICDDMAKATTFHNSQEKIIYKYRKLPLPEDHPRKIDKNFFLHEAEYNKKNKEDFLSSLDMKKKSGEMFKNKNYMKVINFMLEDFKLNNDIIAGYPWFSAWGRDTMITLEAFIIKGKRYIPYVFSILNMYGDQLKEGILPNVKGEGGEGKNYDTADASLWFIQRIYELFDFLNKKQREKLFKYSEDVICNYMFNESLPFYCDKNDNLICIKKDINRALTWMDAKVDGKAVTPRYGKPIEINGLWYSSVMAISEMAKRLGKDTILSGNYSISVKKLIRTSEIIKDSMNRYYVNDMWYDLIDGNDIESKEVRPNYVIALSLPFDFADYQSTFVGYKIAKGKLLTPFGLRSLSPDSNNFVERYEGDQRSRDFAYHQGTVWTWLLLPYARLVRKIILDRDKLKDELISIVSGLRKMIKNGAIASVAEIWDGKDPFVPKGAPAQAWSVAALYYIEKMIEDLNG